MKNINNIEEWYRTELNNYSVQPDKSAWSSLSDQLDISTPLTDENISDWYKKEVSKLEERPNYALWEKLSAKLDTASVWKNIATTLDRYELILWWKNTAIKGTAAILLLLCGYLALNNYTNSSVDTQNNSYTETKTLTSNTINYQKEDPNKYTKESVPNKESIPEKIINRIVNNEQASLSNSKNNYIDNNTKVNNKDLNNLLKGSVKNAITKSKKDIISQSNSNTIDENNSFATTNEMKHYKSKTINNLNSLITYPERSIFTVFDRHKLTEKDISNLYSKSYLVKKNKNKILFNHKRFASYSSYAVYAKKLYYGINIGAKKQGMITSRKKNTLLSEYKQNSLLDFGTNFGAVIGMVLTNKFNVETNLNINSTSGYKRSFNNEGNSFDESLTLNYSSLSLLAKKMNIRSTYDNKIYSTNFIGGIYASYLWSAITDASGVSQKTNQFNDADFGFVLGIEQDRYITKKIILTPGIRYNQGLFNIANENSAFESSRNFSIEFNIGVKYIFLKSR